MKTKKAKKPRYTTVVTRWMYDDKSRARLIARERRKEREKCIEAIQFKARAWAEFGLTIHPASPDRVHVERVLQEFEDIINGIREGAKR